MSTKREPATPLLITTAEAARLLNCDRRTLPKLLRERYGMSPISLTGSNVARWRRSEIVLIANGTHPLG